MQPLVLEPSVGIYFLLVCEGHVIPDNLQLSGEQCKHYPNQQANMVHKTQTQSKDSQESNLQMQHSQNHHSIGRR